QAARRIVGRAGYLGDVERAGLAIHGDDVRERAAGVDADAIAAFSCVHRWEASLVEPPCYPDSCGPARSRAPTVTEYLPAERCACATTQPTRRLGRPQSQAARGGWYHCGMADTPGEVGRWPGGTRNDQVKSRQM